jgi:presenilin-like A22 family membrane protease
MRKPDLTFPELMFVVGTRAFIGAGLGLLISGRLSKRQRQTAGLVLLAAGAITTIPAAAAVFGRK